MATSVRAFNIELYQEHLEEASFLYEQRLSLLSDPEISWIDVGEFEARLEAHIDALVVGGDLAIEVSETQAVEGDFGELYTAVCLFCRQNRRDLVGRVLRDLDMDDEERVAAVTDGLKDEMPDAWADLLAAGLNNGFERLIPIFGRIVGCRRLKIDRSLVDLLNPAPAGGREAVVWALGRLGDKTAKEALYGFLTNDQPQVSAAAAVALLRLGEQRILPTLKSAVLSAEWPLLPLGLAGDRSIAALLGRMALETEVHPDCLLALGLLGDLSTVRILCDRLSDPDLADTAATALNLITGADLYEEAFIPEPIEEDELFEGELERYQVNGEPPLRPDGEPFGESVTRVCQDVEVWNRWLAEQKDGFDPRIRYRNGKPYSPQELLECLRSAKSSFDVRRLSYEELVIRYGMPLAFEADMPVLVQQRALNKIEHWVAALITPGEVGEWSFTDSRPDYWG